MHLRAIGVEDARDADLGTLHARIVEGQRLGGALALVIAGAGAGAVHPAAITLHLRMHLRVAVHFGRGGEQEARARLLGETQQMVGAHHVGQHRVFGIDLILRRRGGTGQIVDAHDAARFAQHRLGQRIDDVALHEGEARPPFQQTQVGGARGLQIVEDDHLPPLVQQSRGQVRADEPRAARDQDHLLRCCHCLFLSMVIVTRPAVRVRPLLRHVPDMLRVRPRGGARYAGPARGPARHAPSPRHLRRTAPPPPPRCRPPG